MYHVLCRGDRREEIFGDDGDRQRLLETLGETCERTGFVLHGYVLMPNHYHLLLETPEPNLVAGMKWFQGTYTQRFNRRHGLTGHLFQGRYKAIPVDTDNPEYFRVLSDYIHLNPARARLLTGNSLNLDSFRWSSYPHFIGSKPLPRFLVRQRVFESHELPDEGRASRRRYAKRMEAIVAELLGREANEELEARWRELRRGWYVGSEAFADRLMDRIDERVRGRRRASYRSDGMQTHDERAAAGLLARGVESLGVTLSELWGRKQTDPIKQGVAWLVKTRTTVTDQWLCEQLEMGSRTNVHRAVQAYRQVRDPNRKSIKAQLQLCAD